MGLFDSLFGKKGSVKASGSPAVPSQPRTASESVVVRGPWMSSLWSDVPVSLPRRPEIPEFLLQTPMPPLLRDDGYAKSNNADSDRVLHWVIALLHHPDPDVVLDIFRFWEEHWARYVQSEVRMPYRTLMFDSAADHLASTREDLAAAAAHFTWRGYSEDNFQNLMSILDDPRFPAKRRAIERLREQCPAEHLMAFRQLIGEKIDPPATAQSVCTHHFSFISQSGQRCRVCQQPVSPDMLSENRGKLCQKCGVAVHVNCQQQLR